MKNQCIRTLNKGKLLKILFLVFFIQLQRVRFMIETRYFIDMHASYLCINSPLVNRKDFLILAANWIMLI